MDVEILGDRYELQEPIGRGGMATIYRAVDLRMGRTVAIKILREVYSSDPKFVTRFQREARAASLLQHPNIVQVFDYGQSGESYYIVMEFVEGIDLRHYLKRHGRLNNDRAVVIAHDVALGLGAAHKRGIVHRDVKPQNIMLNDDELVKLTDFGIASVYKDVGAERLTTTGMTLGTVQYYAPEQAQGEVVTPAADIYALGIVMYEMLTGRTPFDGDTPVAVAMRHIQDLPDPPSQYNPAIAPSLERIILRCLEKDPRDRYRDGDALAYALENFERRPNARASAVPAARMGGAPLSLPSDPRPVAGYGPAAFNGPAVASGPGRGPGAISGPVGGRSGYNSGGPSSGPRGVFDVPGLNTRPYGPAGGTVPRAPSTGRSTGPHDLPYRPDDEGGGRRTGPVVAVTVSAVVLLLGLSCFLLLSLTGALAGLGHLFEQPTATPAPVVVVVPKFKGLTFTAAQTLALQYHLTLTSVYATADPSGNTPPPKDTVLDQNPEPGQYPGIHPTVTLMLSPGLATVKVPDVVGKDETTACGTLQGDPYHLVCNPQGYEASNQPRGTVLRTDPVAGTTVPIHTPVSYWLSAGPPTPTPTATPKCSPTPGPGTPPATPVAGC
jgi:eukaryotic-like serine/threonine-protein kinase